jgi:hypothetical protein
MKKPDFGEVIQRLEEYSQNLSDGGQPGNSKLVLAFVELIKVMAWQSSQQDTNNIQVANLIGETQKLKDITAENSTSSKRFAGWSLGISIVAISVSLFIGGVQIYLAQIQVGPILEQQYRAESNLFEFCKEPGNWNTDEGGATPGSTCRDTYIKLKAKFEPYPPAEQVLTN